MVDPAVVRRRRALLLSVVTGTLATVVGVGLLVLAALWDATPADFLLEIGVAVGLAGVLWRCASQIRRERHNARTDYSALVILGLAGVGCVWWALTHGKHGRDALLTVGAAMVTLWLFCALERQFVLSDDTDFPFWVKVLAAPILPFVWWVTRSLLPGSFDLSLSGPPTLLDVRKLLDELELESQLQAFDGDSRFRDPSYVREVFQPTAEQVGHRLGVVLPSALVTWVDANAGRRFTSGDGAVLTVWPWKAVRLHPVDLPAEVLVFADRRHEPAMAGAAQTQQVLGVDLRSGPLHGAVVRGQLSVGTRPEWNVDQPLEVVAANVALWLAHEPMISVSGTTIDTTGA